MVDLAHRMKAAGRNRLPDGVRPLTDGETLALLFEKPSTRTRVSFDLAMRQLGGQTLVLNKSDIQLARGETISDTARVLSRFVDAIMLRTGPHAFLLELAENATRPVINGLTDHSHPCQILADVMTFEAHRGNIAGRTIAWVGDGNNVAVSWIQAAAKFGFSLRLACPASLQPPEEEIARAQEEGANITLGEDPHVAVSGADAVVTDTWVSMGDANAAEKRALLAPYQVTPELMAKAAADAIFLHCLPAHRGEEVTAEVIDGPRSVVFDEAENRLHAQKAILAWCFALF